MEEEYKELIEKIKKIPMPMFDGERDFEMEVGDFIDTEEIIKIIEVVNAEK